VLKTDCYFQRAFFMPKLFDNNNVEQWQADGAKEINERVIDETLLDYIARRERQILAVDALNNE
jgi:trimethylamine--corrinoid protein Co-methyltransferase